MNILLLKLNRALSALAILIAATPAWAGNIAVSGTIPKVLTSDRINLTFKVTGISKADYDKGVAEEASLADQNQNIAARFKVQVSECDSTVPLAYTADDASNAPCAAYITSWGTHEGPTAESGSSPATYSYTYYISLVSKTTALADVIKNKKALSIYAEFYLGDAKHTSSPIAKLQNPTILTPESYVVDDVPAFAPLALEGSNQGLTVTWVHKDSYNVKTSGGTQTRPTGQVTAYVVDASVVTGATPLPAHSSSLNVNKDDVDLPSGCTFTPPLTDSGACISCSDPTNQNIYLNPDEIAQIDGFHVLSEDSSKTRVSISRLTNDNKYWVFLQYQPQGIQFSPVCYQGSPSEDYTLTEINGEGKAQYVDFRCFIATAAYGSPLHADVRLFRHFRDQVLLKSSAGRAFVAMYYKYSPAAAAFIARHEAARSIARAVLAGPAWILRQLDGPAKEL